MEKKEIQEWRDRLIKMFGVYHSDGQEYVTCPLCGINLDELANHMIKELDRAREEMFTKEELNELQEIIETDLNGWVIKYGRFKGNDPVCVTEKIINRKRKLLDKITSKLTTK